MARHKGLSFYKRKKKISANTMKEIASWLFGIFTAVLFAFVIIVSVGMQISMIGVSMEQCLSNGQKVLVNRFVYKLVAPKKNDVVVFLPNGNQNSHYYIKRVVGVPGDTIQIKEGRLYVNGTAEEDADLYDKMADAGIAANEFILQPDEYFVLGDNRNNSEDSRSGNIGAVHRENIVGKAWFHMASKTDGMGLVE